MTDVRGRRRYWSLARRAGRAQRDLRDEGQASVSRQTHSLTFMASPGRELANRAPYAPYFALVTTNTLNVGPVTGAGTQPLPNGVGGWTATIGRLIEPPPNVPLATGAPNRS